jgi:hypothetical protein
MRGLILAIRARTDALRGDLRPSGRSPRPIPYPQTRLTGQFGGPR